MRWMEWQANTLAPRILMPAVTTRMKFEELYRLYNLENQTNYALIYNKILVEIADTFGVSKQLAKIRLIQLGYNQYVGIDEYLGNDYYSYVAKNINLEPGDTYRIPYVDFLVATFLNKDLKKAIEEEKILYVDGFLILNNKKYVTKVANSYLINEYALNAIDECCLKFKIVHDTKKSIDKMYSMCFLCRSSKDIIEDIPRDIVNDGKNTSLINEALEFKSFLEDDREDDEIISHLHCSFNEAFKYLYDYYEMPSDNYCAKLCGVDHKTIASYYNGTAKIPHYKTVLAICAGFNLRPRICKELLKTIRVNLSDSPFLQDHLYDMLIHTKNELGLKAWNECIKKSKIGDEHLLP